MCLLFSWTLNFALSTYLLCHQLTATTSTTWVGVEHFAIAQQGHTLTTDIQSYPGMWRPYFLWDSWLWLWG